MTRIYLTHLLILFFTQINSQNTVGTLTYLEEESFDGYNLIYSHNQANVYLFNNCGDVINVWEDDIDFRPGNTAYLFENGNLVKTKRSINTDGDPIWANGGGAIVEIRDWDNNLLQSFTLNDSKARLHHDIALTDKGTVLMVAWEFKSFDEAIDAGRRSELLVDGELWPDQVIEWDPNRDEVIWEWHVWDHLIQDFDQTKDNFGVVADHPELVNVNYDEFNGRRDWLHCNSLDYNPVLDQIMLSTPFFDEIWIIDHSTTTEEAASHSGGNSGMGGDLIFRWGNPRTYNSSNEDSQQSFFQHSVKWVNKYAQPNDPQFGRISLFNNRISPRFSSLNALTPPMNELNTNYIFENGRYLPLDFDLSVVHPDTLEIAYSSGLSSVQILPNDNILALAGRWGYAYELTPENKVVWEYRVPFMAGQPVEQGTELTVNQNLTFRIDRYELDFAGFAGRDLSSGPRIELNPNDLFCEVVSATEEVVINDHLIILENPVINDIMVQSNQRIEIRIIDSNGLIVGTESLVEGMNVIDVQNLRAGLYFIQTEYGTTTRIVKIAMH